MLHPIHYVSFGHIDVSLPLIKRLRQKGIDLEVIFVFQSSNARESVFDFADMAHEPGFLSDEYVKSRLPQYIKEYFGEEIARIKVFIFPNYKLVNWRSFKAVVTLCRYLRRSSIIHISGAGLLLWDRIFLFGKRIIYTVHDLKVHSGEEGKNSFSEKLFNTTIDRAKDVVVQNSDDYQLLINKKKRGSVHMIPFGKMEYLEGYHPSDNKIYDFLFWGRISKYKGLQYLLLAFKKAQEQFPSATLCIAGNGYVEEIDDFKKMNNVKVINRFLHTEEINELLAYSRIAVCPYTDATQSGVAMTAFGLNFPIIASAVGGFKDIIEDGVNGLLVNPQDADDLLNKMLMILEKPKLVNEMAANIDMVLKKRGFDWQTITDSMISLYKNP